MQNSPVCQLVSAADQTMPSHASHADQSSSVASPLADQDMPMAPESEMATAAEVMLAPEGLAAHAGQPSSVAGQVGDLLDLHAPVTPESKLATEQSALVPEVVTSHPDKVATLDAEAV